ncbi:cupin domain-containing protein [Candidatus Pantoea multigeneris]|uniref:DUF861 domain-containing protein n=1 Tax=Candidatus Pantoea multigeneris TaxID=2608357 RepID=A0ABX0R414_9GAMM|nr:cupin domain-containing protein [Pantoea multigeneris]NIF20146.1 DUF861 domain-containing protein [Pantoea multigeneris]
MTGKIAVVKKATTAVIATDTAAKFPLSELIAYQGSVQHQEAPEIGASTGVWESTPGVFRRYLKNREFSHIISGWCIFTPDGGEPVELRAGDAVLFPENCEGVWDIKETLRKTYLLF